MIEPTISTPVPTRKQKKPAKPETPTDVPVVSHVNPRKKRKVDQRLQILLESFLKRETDLKKERKTGMSELRGIIAREKRVGRQMLRIEQWSVEDKQRLFDDLSKLLTPKLPLGVKHEPPTEIDTAPSVEIDTVTA